MKCTGPMCNKETPRWRKLCWGHLAQQSRNVPNWPP